MYLEEVESERDEAGGLVVQGMANDSTAGAREIGVGSNFEVQVIVMGGKVLKRADHVVEMGRKILEVFRSVVVGMDPV